MRRAALLFVLMCSACGTGTEPDPCLGAPTFTNDIFPLITDHCIACHDENLSGDARNGAPEALNFNRYETVEPHLLDFANVVTAGRMPPADAPGVVPLTPDERATVDAWRRCGFPR